MGAVLLLALILVADHDNVVFSNQVSFSEEFLKRMVTVIRIRFIFRTEQNTSLTHLKCRHDMATSSLSMQSYPQDIFPVGPVAPDKVLMYANWI